MYYFLVNNTFHALDAIDNIIRNKISSEKVFFIVCPHVFDFSVLNEYKYVILKSPLVRRFGFFNVFSLIRARLSLNKALEGVEVEDTLFIYTEYEVFNHLVVNFFYEKKCKILAIEENGLATYAFNKLDNKVTKSYLLGWDVRFFLVSVIWNCFDSKILKVDGNKFPLLSDYKINYYIYYSSVSSNRKIEVLLLNKFHGIEVSENKTKKALYLNQDLYNFYMSESEYLEYLDEVIGELKLVYDEVYFKYHPRETNISFRDKMSVILQDVKVIYDSQPVEIILDTISPDVVCSFNSSALINLNRQGINVKFFYDRWNGYLDNQLILAIDESLKEMKENTLDIKRISNIFTVGNNA